MYAHLDHASRRGHTEGDSGLADHGNRMGSTDGPPGLWASVAFRQLAGQAGVCLTLWDTEADAVRFASQHADQAALPGQVYEVTGIDEGSATTQAPSYARLMYFDGPRVPEQAAAEDLAGQRRIWPAIRGLSGLVRTYVLRGPDLGCVVITLATSVEALDAIARAVMATELMPGEDPALLPGPDRIEIHHVTGYHMSRHLPSAVPAASTKGH
jgi:hypothetical protein